MVTRVIARYNLHATVPVCLDPLEDLFLVRFTDMSKLETSGAILTPANGWPVSPSNRARILIDYNLGRYDARLVLAHEIGHGLCHHVGHFSSEMLGLEDKHEREAWVAAAQLLIPERVVMEEREAQQIAATCEVPVWLVELWRSTNG